MRIYCDALVKVNCDVIQLSRILITLKSITDKSVFVSVTIYLHTDAMT